MGDNQENKVKYDLLVIHRTDIASNLHKVQYSHIVLQTHPTTKTKTEAIIKSLLLNYGKTFLLRGLKCLILRKNNK